MGTHEEIARLMYLVKQEGMDIGQCRVVADGMFFYDHRLADLFSKHHDKELKRVDGLVSAGSPKTRTEVGDRDGASSR
jgi:hypothetical protein